MLRGLCLGMSPSEVRMLEGVASVATETHWFYDRMLSDSTRLVISLRFSEEALAHVKVNIEVPEQHVQQCRAELAFALGQIHGESTSSDYMQAWNLSDHAELILGSGNQTLTLSVLQKDSLPSSQERTLKDDSGPYPALCLPTPSEDTASYPTSDMDNLQYTLNSVAGQSISIDGAEEFDSVSGVRLTKAGYVVDDAKAR